MYEHMVIFMINCTYEGIMMIIEFLFFKQKTAYEMRISDWSSDVCSADLLAIARPQEATLKIADTGTDLAGLIVPAFVGPFGIGNYGTGDKHHVAAPIGNRLIRKGGSQDAQATDRKSVV